MRKKRGSEIEPEPFPASYVIHEPIRSLSSTLRRKKLLLTLILIARLLRLI